MLSTLSQARQRRLDDEDGFTLIELLVVVVILGILIAIAIPVYLNYQKSANDKAAQSDLRNAISVLEVCNSDSGYPTAVTSAGAMTGCASQSIKASSGTQFRYVYTSASSSYTIYANNSSGSGKMYCYNSVGGGSVKDASGTAGTTIAALTAATCPA